MDFFDIFLKFYGFFLFLYFFNNPPTRWLIHGSARWFLHRVGPSGLASESLARARSGDSLSCSNFWAFNNSPSHSTINIKCNLINEKWSKMSNFKRRDHDCPFIKMLCGRITPINDLINDTFIWAIEFPELNWMVKTT